MASIDFDITDNSGKVLEEVKASVARALEACSMQAQTFATELAPVDTGRLKNSIMHAVDDDTGYVGTNVEYAIYQELGTYKIPAKNFLRKSVSDHVDQYRAVMEQYLKG